MLNLELAKGLLSNGREPTNRHPLLKCIFRGDKIPKEVWSKEILNIEDESHWTPLTAMVALRRLNEIPEELLSKETLNTPNSLGWTPLHKTISWGYTPEVNYLISKGANPSIKTSDGKSCQEIYLESDKLTNSSKKMTNENQSNNNPIMRILNEAKLKKEKDLIKRKLSDSPINL
jgi:ankyrin repeat protein